MPAVAEEAASDNHHQETLFMNDNIPNLPQKAAITKLTRIAAEIHRIVREYPDLSLGDVDAMLTLQCQLQAYAKLLGSLDQLAFVNRVLDKALASTPFLEQRLKVGS